MTRVYKKLYNKRQEEQLIADILHKVAKRMECKADSVGYDIDANTDWIEAHRILLSWEFDGTDIPVPGIYDLFERIAACAGYDFWRGFIYYLNRISV